MKWIDIPPVWLLASMAITHLVAQVSGDTAGADKWAVQMLGAGLIGIGLLLMGGAVLEMRRFKTTVLPHMTADTLVRTGVFAYSRNPIYLGDMLVLAGYVFWTGGFAAAPLMLVLFWVLEVRFIRPEEHRLAAKFGEAFDRYTQQTRRWL
ncbi:methyltransferase family protein [Pseudooctadecabacter sp.]|uniref:methyltransferase family protein n=1 Tax=Pseudooctadecabacter sp. TaxID=1966338 RepID=UPI0035C80802